jgi:hypothetical protein
VLASRQDSSKLRSSCKSRSKQAQQVIRKQAGRVRGEPIKLNAATIQDSSRAGSGVNQINQFPYAANKLLYWACGPGLFPVLPLRIREVAATLIYVCGSVAYARTTHARVMRVFGLYPLCFVSS